nr:hypothetical protein JVH1_7030 [Rhodococcus sp. JVH1]
MRELAHRPVPPSIGALISTPSQPVPTRVVSGQRFVFVKH